MKICLFTRTTLAHSIGGMEVHADLLAKGLAALGHRVTVITTGHPYHISEEDKAGVKTIYLEGTMPGKYSYQWKRSSQRVFSRLHQQENFDIIISESAGAFHFLRSGLSRKLPIPVVVILHGIFYNEMKTRFNLGFSPRNVLASLYFILVYLFKDLFCLPKATAVIATSFAQRRLIKKFYFLPAEKVFTVFNGIETQILSEDATLKSTLGFSSSDKIIVGIARLKKEKGIHVLIDALPAILKQVPQAKAVIIGDGEYRPVLERQVQRLNLQENVKFTGAVPYPELGKYLQMAEVFVNSTIRENGYDLTIIQAMVYGKVVVVSDLQSLAGVIESGENGFLFPRGDVLELSRSVVNVLESREIRGKIGSAAREKVLRFFSVENMVQATEDVLKKCLPKK